MTEGECADPRDLSAVADAVFAKTGSQQEIVRRLPVVKFQNASPNEGHKLLCALLRERAIGSTLTLNFDLAISHGLAAMGAAGDIAVISSPTQLADLGASNVIHLHADANASPETWILRTDQLETLWRDGWQDLVTTRVITAPVVVFAGLGAPASVLVESVRRIRAALPSHVIIHVDPGAYGSSEFTSAIDVVEERYVRLGWCEFMRRLGDRVAAEQLSALGSAAAKFLAEEEWEDPGCEDLVTLLAALGLLGLGQTRAAWFLDQGAYLPAMDLDLEAMAVLIYAIALTARVGRCDVVPQPNGNLELRRESRLIGHLVPASGRGTKSRTRIEAALRSLGRLGSRYAYEPVVVLIASSLGADAISPPDDLVAQSSPESLVAPTREAVVLSIEELRNDPTALTEALGA
ncbi:MAG: hypothetical protein WDA27_07810 [Actinomycetota bacterium]